MSRYYSTRRKRRETLNIKCWGGKHLSHVGGTTTSRQKRNRVLVKSPWGYWLEESVK